MPPRTVPIQEAKPGMILEEAVIDAAGRMLIPAGLRLSPLQVSCLGRWGIAQILVREEEDPPLDTRPMLRDTAFLKKTGRLALRATEATESFSYDEFARQVDESLAHRFRRVEKIPLMRELREFVRHRLLAHAGPLPGQR